MLGWCSAAVLSSANVKPAVKLHLFNIIQTYPFPFLREKLVTLVSLVLQDHREKRYGVLLHNPALGSEVQ